MPKELLKKRVAAFTLIEVLVAIAVLAMLITMIAQLFSNATMVSNLSNDHLEADARVQVLFGRMAADFSRVVKRNDVDYYFKSPSYLPSPSSTIWTPDNPQIDPVNDQMAFFSEVSGYSPSSVATPKNTVSLVSYRINNTGTKPALERMGTALSWGGGVSGLSPVAFAPATISSIWPAATLTPPNSTATDPVNDANFETIVPNAFRFEYYYLLTNGQLSAVPWDSSAGHTAINGLQDVAGIGVVVAVTDMKVSSLVSSAQLQALASQLANVSYTGVSPYGISPSSLTLGALQANWQNSISGSTLSPTIKNGIRVYEHLFPIKTPSQ